MEYLSSAWSYFFAVISHDNFVYGLFFVAADIILTLIVVSRLLESRENKKWRPLRKSILISTQAFVINLFNAHRVLASSKNEDGLISAQGVSFFYEQMNKLKSSRTKLLNDISLYGAGMGGEILPKLASLEESYNHIFNITMVYLHPFAEGSNSENCKYLAEIHDAPYKQIIEGLKELEKLYPELLKLSDSYWDIVCMDVVESNLKNLFDSFSFFVGSWDEVPKSTKQVRVFNLASLGKIGAPPEDKQHIVINQLTDFGVH